MVKPSPLEAALAEVPRARKGPSCGVGIALEKMTDGERAAVLRAFADPDAGGPWLSKTLQANGYPISVCQIGRHRRKECACP